MKKLIALLLALLMLALPACAEEEAPKETTPVITAKSGMTLTSVEYKLQNSLDQEIKLVVDGNTAHHTDESMFAYTITVDMVDTKNVSKITFVNSNVDKDILVTEGQLSATMRKDATSLTASDLTTLQPVMQMITLMDLVEVDTSTITVDDLSATIAAEKAYTSNGWKVFMELDGSTATVIAQYVG